MGDVSTHGTIASAVMPLLNAPEAPLFEIGNWLTDVRSSETRSPTFPARRQSSTGA